LRIFAQLLIDYRGIIEYSLSNRHGLVLLRSCFYLSNFRVIFSMLTWYLSIHTKPTT
jgi:hypothetical protein